MALIEGDRLASAPVAEVGGKAAGLAALVAHGLRVPPFFVVPVSVWRAGGGRTIPESELAAIRARVDAFGPVPLVVRSSAGVEDSAAASWAGQFESFVGVVGADAVIDAVQRCWRSADTDRVAAYAGAVGLADSAERAMAVVVQVMATGEASGVLFSRDPDDPDRALISVGLGLGEGVVQGRVPCDTFRVDPKGLVEATIERKDEETVLAPEGPVARAVDDARRDAPAIGDPLAAQLAAVGRALESRLGRPVDAEFTIVAGEPVWLQVRPIAIPIPRGRRLLWDNSNIVESYSGITTPLTFSFASRAYTIVYQLFCRVMGVDDATIRANEPVFRRMIGLVRGRIYYNLDAWYRVLQLLPGFSFNRRAMETMMGVGEVATDEEAGETSRFREGASLARLGLRLAWRLVRIERDAAVFQDRFRRTLERCRAVDLDALRPDELLELYEEVERELLWAWTPPLVNDFFCMIFYKLLQKRCQELTGDEATPLHNRLLAGEGQLASAAPALELGGLARLVTAEPALAAVFVGPATDDEAHAAGLASPAFRAGFERWMDAFGDRSPDELKLESPTLQDTPGFVVATVRGWVRHPENVRAFGEERGDREAAEALVAKLLRGGWPWRRAAFRFILGQARRRVGLRESLRFERTRIFGFVRRLFRAFGRRYAESGALDAERDVFFLTVDEILGFVRGTAPSADLKGLVAVRRREHEANLAAEPPAERFRTWGAVHVANRFRGRVVAAPVTGDAIQGTPCSPGVVTAVARVVRDPRECPDLGGAILVAHRTDPGWVPLYPTAGGIVVERGSLLSHSAVVARELGLPAVVGCRGLLEWVRDGETITVDGSTGVVRRG